MMKIMKNSERR